MGTHESQSLFWERHVGLSRPFWSFAGPLVRSHLGVEASDSELYAAVNAVKPSLIRVEADEVTYPLHVIIRTSIERAVVNGDLSVSDIPSAWNEKHRDLLGVSVPSDASGCLQDVHWSGLAFGYFPTYLVGAMGAAQLAHYARRDVHDFDGKVAKGEFGEIREWLAGKVHAHGSRYDSFDDLLEDQVGERLNPEYFLTYLEKKYADLYKF